MYSSYWYVPVYITELGLSIITYLSACMGWVSVGNANKLCWDMTLMSGRARANINITNIELKIQARSLLWRYLEEGGGDINCIILHSHTYEKYGLC